MNGKTHINKKLLVEYPIEEKVYFELSIPDPETPKIVQLKMYDEDDTLGYLISNVFSEKKDIISFSGNRMNHPFLKDMETNRRICYVYIGFVELKTLDEYRVILDGLIQECLDSVFEPTVSEAIEIFSK